MLNHNTIVINQDPTSIELHNGGDACQGLVKFRNLSTGILWQACSSTAGNSAALVICRQVGCFSSLAETVNSTK